MQAPGACMASPNVAFRIVCRCPPLAHGRPWVNFESRCFAPKRHSGKRYRQFEWDVLRCEGCLTGSSDGKRVAGDEVRHVALGHLCIGVDDGVFVRDQILIENNPSRGLHRLAV